MVLTRTSLATFTVTAVMVLAACGSSRRQTAYITTPLNNGVSAYRLDTNTGGFKQILGSPYVTGISPTSVVVDPSGKFVYVSNAGENTISFYKIDSTGALTEVTPRTPTQMQPSALIIDPAGKLLFAVNSASNTISSYSIGSSGALTVTSGSPYQTSGFTPIRGSITPSGKFLYVTNSNSATITGFSIDSSGALTPVPNSPIAVGNAPNWIAIDPSGKFLYVANLEDGTFSGFAIDATSGGLTSMSGSPFGVVSGTNITPVSSLVVDASGKYLYVSTLSASSNVYGYTIDGTSGVPTAISAAGFPIAAGGSADFIVNDTSGTLIFVGNQTSSSISGFKITPASGVLTLVSTTSTGSAPTSMSLIK
jgi:6-phosphogluconolactonase (cycloisomerase 2 family)